jgi:surfeit locus 1 family protein
MRIRFAPRLVPTLAAIAMIALTVSLGRWQAGRAEEKAGLQATYDARAREAPVVLGAASGASELLYRRVQVKGTWMPEGQVFIDNRIHAGKAGFHVVTPVRLAGGSRVVLVNRGWTPRTAAYPAPPPIAAPTGEADVSGLAAVPPRRYLELSGDTVTGNVWQNLSLARYAERARVDLVPVLVLADRAEAGLEPVREKPDAGIEKHREYELTWFSLAATLAALWAWYSFRRVAR